MKTAETWIQQIITDFPSVKDTMRLYQLRDIIKRIQSEAITEGRRRSTANILRVYPTLNHTKVRIAAANDPDGRVAA